MNLLLDTHALIWWALDDPRLGATARAAIAAPENDVRVSAASAMEISTKHRLGKLPQAAALAIDFDRLILRMGFSSLRITAPHARLAGAFTFAHRDPFDRLLVAQSLLEQTPLVSNETLFDEFGVTRIW